MRLNILINNNTLLIQLNKAMKLFVAFTLLIVAVACSKESTDDIIDVSGTYYCRDTTHNQIYNYPDPTTYETHDTNYTINISYSDRENNIVQIGNSKFTLDKSGTYSSYGSSPGGSARQKLTLSNNQLYYLYDIRSGGSTYYTLITGTKTK